MARSRRSYRDSSVIRDFGQWVVTKYGLECRDEYYPLAANTLDDPYIETHVTGKIWCNGAEFLRALAFAREYHARKIEGGRP